MQSSSARGNLRVVKMGWGVAVRELRARKEASGGEETEQDANQFCQQQLQDKPLGVPLQMAVTPQPSVEARSPFSSNCNTQ